MIKNFLTKTENLCIGAYTVKNLLSQLLLLLKLGVSSKPNDEHLLENQPFSVEVKIP